MPGVILIVKTGADQELNTIVQSYNTTTLVLDCRPLRRKWAGGRTRCMVVRPSELCHRFAKHHTKTLPRAGEPSLVRFTVSSLRPSHPSHHTL